MSKEWTRFLFRWLCISAGLHFLAAIFSSGFYHPDEHFQILEFLNFKLGKTPVSDLPCEFARMIRSWVQPALYLSLVKGLSALKIENPFQWAMGFRIFSAMIGWLSTAALMFCCPFWFKNLERRKWAVIALATLWCLPSFHARHSSENLSGSIFFLGMCWAYLLLQIRGQISVWNTFGIGILFGLAFEFRFQTGFMVLGVMAWLLLIGRVPLKSWGVIVGGIFLSCALGTVLDRWGYGQWTFSPKNYVLFNLIENHISEGGVRPWWDFFRSSFTEAWPLLGFLLIVSLPISWIRNPLNILTWSTLPFFLVHVVIGHKELRFLFPMLSAGPVLLILGIEGVSFLSPFLRWPAKALVGVNVIALISLCLTPAWAPVRFQEKLYEFQEGIPLEIFYKDNHPFQPLGGRIYFYRRSYLTTTQIPSYEAFLKQIGSQRGPLYLFSTHTHLSPGSPGAAEVEKFCTPQFRALPEWIEKFNLFRLLDRVSNWSLFRCQFSGKSL